MNISSIKKFLPLILLVVVLAVAFIIFLVYKDEPPVDDTPGITTEANTDLTGSTGASTEGSTGASSDGTTGGATEAITGDSLEATTGDATEVPTQTTGAVGESAGDGTAPSTEAPTDSTQSTSGTSTEPTTNNVTEPTTGDKSMDDPTEATTSATEAPTQPSTETQPNTEPTTQPSTEETTQPTIQAPTEEHTQPSTEETTTVPEESAFFLNIKAPATAAPGDVFDVVVTLKDIQEPLCAVEFFLDFDESKLSGIITEAGAAMDAFMTVTPTYTMAIAGMEIQVPRFEQICCYDASNGIYECRFLDLLQYPNAKAGEKYNGLTNDGELVITIQFKVLETASKGDKLVFTMVKDSIVGTTVTLNGTDGTANTATVTIT